VALLPINEWALGTIQGGSRSNWTATMLTSRDTISCSIPLGKWYCSIIREEREGTHVITDGTHPISTILVPSNLASQSVSQMRPFNNRSCDFAKKLLSSESVPVYRANSFRKTSESHLLPCVIVAQTAPFSTSVWFKLNAPIAFTLLGYATPVPVTWCRQSRSWKNTTSFSA
jgi:hypothetical protein